jgi:hypothetical protein
LQSACSDLLANAIPLDLARVVEAWSELPLHIKTSILALVEAARK